MTPLTPLSSTFLTPEQPPLICSTPMTPFLPSTPCTPSSTSLVALTTELPSKRDEGYSELVLSILPPLPPSEVSGTTRVSLSQASESSSGLKSKTTQFIENIQQQIIVANQEISRLQSQIDGLEKNRGVILRKYLIDHDFLMGGINEIEKQLLTIQTSESTLQISLPTLQLAPDLIPTSGASQSSIQDLISSTVPSKLDKDSLNTQLLEFRTQLTKINKDYLSWLNITESDTQFLKMQLNAQTETVNGLKMTMCISKPQKKRHLPETTSTVQSKNKKAKSKKKTKRIKKLSELGSYYWLNHRWPILYLAYKNNLSADQINKQYFNNSQSNTLILRSLTIVKALINTDKNNTKELESIRKSYGLTMKNIQTILKQFETPFSATASTPIRCLRPSTLPSSSTPPHIWLDGIPKRIEEFPETDRETISKKRCTKYERWKFFAFGLFINLTYSEINEQFFKKDRNYTDFIRQDCETIFKSIREQRDTDEALNHIPKRMLPYIKKFAFDYVEPETTPLSTAPETPTIPLSPLSNKDLESFTYLEGQ